MAVKKKAKAKKAAPKKKAKAKGPAKPKMPKEKKLAEVLHYYGKICVAALKVKAPMKAGDIIHIKGHTTDFEQPVESMQIEHVQMQAVKKGDDVGLLVKDHVREGDGVFLKN